MGCQCVKGEGHKIRMPAHTVPGPRLAQRPEHTSVAMDPTVVLQQAGVSASMGLEPGPALPFAMRTVGSDSTFRECASPIASASGLMSAWVDTLAFCCHTMTVHDFDDCSRLCSGLQFWRGMFV